MAVKEWSTVFVFRVDDNWSDVASDMYRIKKHSSYQASAPSTKYRDLKITDASDAKSDCSG